MKRAILPLVFGAGIFLSTLNAHAQTFEILNLTHSGGSESQPVVTDLTFESLVLTETFADATTAHVSLSATSLTSADLFLDTAVANPDPTHGAITMATLTGDIGNVDSVTVQPTLDPASAHTVAVSRYFVVNLNGPDPAFPNGSVNVGTFSLLDANGIPVSTPFSKAIELAITPEPGALALFAASSLGMSAFWLRRRAVRR